MKDKIQQVVRAGIAKVPAPIQAATRTTVFLGGCTVLGGALIAYGTGECTGEEAITGVVIGAGVLCRRALVRFAMRRLVKTKED